MDKKRIPLLLLMMMMMMMMMMEQFNELNDCDYKTEKGNQSMKIQLLQLI